MAFLAILWVAWEALKDRIAGKINFMIDQYMINFDSSLYDYIPPIPIGFWIIPALALAYVLVDAWRLTKKNQLGESKYPRPYFVELQKKWDENEELGWTSATGALQAILKRRERPHGLNIKTRKYFSKWLDADALENLDKLYEQGDLIKIRQFVRDVTDNLDEHLKPELR